MKRNAYYKDCVDEKNQEVSGVIWTCVCMYVCMYCVFLYVLCMYVCPRRLHQDHATKSYWESGVMLHALWPSTV